MEQSHQDLYKLAEEIKNKHGGFVVIELENVNGSNRGIKLHYFKDMEQAAEHIHRDMEQLNARMAQEEASLVLHHGGEEQMEKEFVVVDKDEFEKLVAKLREKKRLSSRTASRSSPLSSESRRSSLLSSESRRSSPRSSPPYFGAPLSRGERVSPISPRRSLDLDEPLFSASPVLSRRGY